MNNSIRRETPMDHRIVEEVVREAFWGCANHPTCGGERNPVCSLIQSKAGISLYRVKTEGKSLVLKVFEKQEDTREIENDRILFSLEIPALSLLGYTKNAILLRDVEASADYRLGKVSDLSDPKVAGAIAKWYKMPHTKGSEYLSCRETRMYDESDMLTADNLRLIAEKTGTADNVLWQAITDNYSMIRSRIDVLPRMLTYNAFYWTNLSASCYAV